MAPDGLFGMAEAGNPPLIADRYEIRDRIGHGSYGEVFEAYDHRLSRLVALKTLPMAGLRDERASQDLSRFQREARALARLSHPGIVTVHDVGETADFAWFAMELVIGDTLRAILERDGRPGLAESVRIVTALLAALDYAHGRGIVHRDVKPANILLSVDPAAALEDGLGSVRLADFGIASMAIASLGESQQTLVGEVLGTPSTMAPEQVRGEPVDARADLWAAGVILYEMLTGQRPFAGGLPMVFQNILHSEPVPPSQLAPEVPALFDAVLAKALAKRPEDRFADAAGMAAAIRAAAEPVAPALPALTPAMPQGGARRRLLPGVLLGLALGIPAGFGLGLVQWPVLEASSLPAIEATPSLIAAEPAPVEPQPVRSTGLPPNPEPSPETILALPEPLPAEPPAILAAPAPTPELPPQAAPPAAMKPAATRGPAPALAACGPDRLVTRHGNHPGFGRLVFAWAAPVEYRVEPLDGGALLHFPGTGCRPAVAGLAAARNIRAVVAAPDGAIRIETAPGATLRHFRLPGRVVIDVQDAAAR